MGRPVSVVLPVHNARPYLDASIRSIIGQTFADFDFIIRDDGSTDGSTEILRRWAGEDRRIRLFLGDERLGPVGSSNWVVARATSPLVARMDADDVAHPDRLRRQFQVLERHPDVGLVGTLFATIDSCGKQVLPADRASLTSGSLAPPFAHGSAMFRRELFERVGGYRKACVLWEDLDLYLRLHELTRIVVVPEVLYFFRHAETGTRLAAPEQYETAIDLQLRCMTAFAASANYEAVLAAGPTTGKKLPHAVIAVGALRLWAGSPPRVLGRVLQRAAIGVNRQTVAALAWALLAELSPRALRLLLRIRRRARDLMARHRLARAELYDWPARPASSKPPRRRT